MHRYWQFLSCTKSALGVFRYTKSKTEKSHAQYWTAYSRLVPQPINTYLNEVKIESKHTPRIEALITFNFEKNVITII